MIDAGAVVSIASFKKARPAFRQFDVTSNSVEQLRAMLRFKARDRVAGGGLRQI